MTPFAISADAVTERVHAMRLTAEGALTRVQAVASSDPTALAKVVAGYRALLGDTGRRIVIAQARVIQARAQRPTDAALAALERRVVGLLTTWAAHAQGYMPYERPATEAEKGAAVAVGWAGIVIALAVAGAVIAVSLTGIAWAAVHYREAQTLADEVALIERDPTLAEPLARVNQTAPQSPSPVVPSVPGGGVWGWLLLGLGLAGAAVYIVPKLGKG